MYQSAEVVLFDKRDESFLKTDEWQFSAKHRWSWVRRIQVATFRWLIRSGALQNTIGKTVVYQKVEISDRNPTVRSLREVVIRMARDGHRPSYLYVGIDMAESMMGNLRDAVHVMSFTHGRPREIMGIPWTVVPWMEGWVIVPEDRA